MINRAPRSKTWLLLVLNCAMSMFASVSANAEINYLPYRPELGDNFSLGTGVDIRSLTSPRNKCTVESIADSDLVDGPGAGDTTFKSYFVSDESHIAESLGVSAQVEARYLNAKLAASYGFSKQRQRTERTVSVLVIAKSVYSNRVLRSVTIAPNYAAMNDHDFLAACGTHYAQAQHRASYLSALVTLSRVSETNRQKINAALSASGGYGPFSGSAKAAFNEERSSDTSHTRVDIEIVSFGGPGFGAAGDLIKSQVRSGEVSIDDLGSKLAELVKTFTADKAFTTGYTIVRWPGRGSSITPWAIEKERKLAELAQAYSAIDEVVSNLEPLLRQPNPDERVKYFAASTLQYYAALLPKLRVYRQQIRTSHAACMSNLDDHDDQTHACDAPAAPAEYVAERMPPPKSVASGSFRIISEGPDPLRSELDSWLLLQSPSDPLTRVRLLSPEARYADLVYVTDGPYADHYEIRLTPTGQFREQHADKAFVYVFPDNATVFRERNKCREALDRFSWEEVPYPCASLPFLLHRFGVRVVAAQPVPVVTQEYIEALLSMTAEEYDDMEARALESMQSATIAKQNTEAWDAGLTMPVGWTALHACVRVNVCTGEAWVSLGIYDKFRGATDIRIGSVTWNVHPTASVPIGTAVQKTIEGEMVFAGVDGRPMRWPLKYSYIFQPGE